MSGVNDQVSSELEKEEVAAASSGEDVSRGVSEECRDASSSVEELLAALQNAER